MSSSAVVDPAVPEPLARWPEGAMQVVGHAHARASARAKVTGGAQYASDVARPGMVHAALVRSTVACGTIASFDGARARAIDGVLAVLGPFDLAWPGIAVRTSRLRPVIDAAVRFVGEEIGVVVADDESAARRAARAVGVRVDAMRACVTIDDALAADAPPVARASAHGNVAGGVQRIEHGDLAQAEAAAEVTIDAHYSTGAQHHNCLEPHGCVAEWAGDTLTLWDSNQGGHLIREHLAATLELPLERVHVIGRFTGGGFGSKIFVKPYHVIAALAARHVGRPVRLFMARREEFVASHQRAPTRRRIGLGATRAGRLTFIDERITGQAGPCPIFAVNAAGAASGLRLHRADALRAQLCRVLTNTQSPVPFRGPTAAEDIFCLEQAIDELAFALRIDPLELRLRNLAEVDALAGLPYAGKQLERCYRLGAQAFGWRHPAPRSSIVGDLARGIGVGAVAYDATLYEPSVAEAACVDGGRIEIRVGVADIGTGADTVFAQIAAEELGVPLSQIDTHWGDTADTPRSIDASNHSRTSAVVGPSVRAAAHALKQALLAAGAQVLRVDASRVALSERGVALRDDSTHGVSLANLVEANGSIGRAAQRERGPDGVFAAMFGAHFVEVEVDLRSGQVRVLRAVCAHDAGRILNPRLAEGQVHGGFIQGMGMALQEERLLDPRSGAQLNAAMWAYRTPTIADAPASITFVDAGVPDGGNSLGVKGIGEPPLIASGAAIANAIHHAIGVRLRDYPITPDKVLAALREIAP
ncbi:MAG TPA: xanthine dehydrogenase family protein molybdopterin-binding subunit [Burkholderiaceae bacterium]|nr:xanthine dehydrogenase family protein molybdopterin-binding subunit [Burkholderiaceae bacterium]